MGDLAAALVDVHAHNGLGLTLDFLADFLDREAYGVGELEGSGAVGGMLYAARLVRELSTEVGGSDG